MAIFSWSSGQVGYLSRYFASAGCWADLWRCGVSYVEMLLLCALWAGARLVLEKAVTRYRRPGRPISVSAVPVGLGIDIWRSCRFIVALIRSLCALPDKICRFMPCSVGANHCRPGHLGWRSVAMGSLLGLGRQLRALLPGALPLRYCAARFACDTPTWWFGDVGVVGLGRVGKRVRLNRKTPAHLVRQGSVGIQSRPRVWKRLRVQVASGCDRTDANRRRAVRLRSWWRHEQQTVRVVLATVEHHSYGAPRGQTTATSTMRQGDRSPLLPSRSSSSCTRRSPAGA